MGDLKVLAKIFLNKCISIWYDETGILFLSRENEGFIFFLFLRLPFRS